MLGIAFPRAAFVAAAEPSGPIPTTLPAATAADAAAGAVPPLLILLMCVLAGIATVLVLPSRRESPLRKVGGAMLLAVGLIVAAMLVRYAAHHGGGLGVYFWAFSAIAIGGAVRVVTHPRPVYSALYFILTVFATAGLFILLWAEFMAAALVLIYAGAILVTYVFVIMLAASAAPAQPGIGADETGNGDGVGWAAARAAAPQDRAPNFAPIAEHDAVSREPLVASAVGFALMGVLLFVIFDRSAGLIGPHDRDAFSGRMREEPVVAETAGATQKLGAYLFQNHVVNLELAGLLLTVSMVGAIIIARRRVVLPAADRGAVGVPVRGREGTAAGAMSAIDDDPHAIPVYGTRNARQKEYPEA